eukprot:jgi/Botrbrau1/17947/Bobra.50_1s0042.1
MACNYCTVHKATQLKFLLFDLEQHLGRSVVAYIQSHDASRRLTLQIQLHVPSLNVGKEGVRRAIIKHEIDPCSMLGICINFVTPHSFSGNCFLPN